MRKKEVLTIKVELGALVEETETLGTVLASEKVAKGTSERARDNLDLVAGEGGIVAASNLGTLARSRANVGESDCGSSESKKSGGELHFEFGCLKRTNVLRKVGKSKECLSGRLLGKEVNA